MLTRFFFFSWFILLLKDYFFWTKAKYRLISATEMFSRKSINACAEEKASTDVTHLKRACIRLKGHDKLCSGGGGSDLINTGHMVETHAHHTLTCHCVYHLSAKSLISGCCWLQTKKFRSDGSSRNCAVKMAVNIWLIQLMNYNKDSFLVDIFIGENNKVGNLKKQYKHL